MYDGYWMYHVFLWTRSHDDTVPRYWFYVFRKSQSPAILFIRYDIDSQDVETNKLRYRRGSISYHIKTSKYLKYNLNIIKSWCYFKICYLKIILSQFIWTKNGFSWNYFIIWLLNKIICYFSLYFNTFVVIYCQFSWLTIYLMLKPF